MISCSPVPLSPVFVLRGIGCPPAVFRCVPSFIIDAVYGEAERLLSHVCKKILEAVQPTITYCYASRTVVFVAFIFRVVAACLHVRPRTEGGRPTPRCMPVGTILPPGHVPQEAPTRSSVAAVQVAGAHTSFRAARASTPPMYDADPAISLVAVRKLYDSETAELLACDINEFGHYSLRERLACQVVTGPGKVRSLRLNVT